MSNETQYTQHNYDEIESSLKQQCEFVDTLVNNIVEINQELKQYSNQSLDQWVIEKQQMIDQIDKLNIRIERMQSEYEQELANQEIKFQISKQNLIEEISTKMQVKDNQIIKLQSEIKLMTKLKDEVQNQMIITERKASIDQTELMQKQSIEKELIKYKEENKLIKLQLQQLQDKNAKYEEQMKKQYQQFQEQLQQKQQEIHQVKELAQVIIDQRTYIEDLFVEALEKVESGDDIQIKKLSQKTKIAILKDIIGTISKQNKIK